MAVKEQRLYQIWTGIKQRCYNEESPAYARYGGRGVVMCKEWHNSYDMFCKWAIANGYADNLTIDRIDNNGNYEPSNCRWVTMREQSNNRSTCRMYEYNGKRMTLKQWCEKLGLPYKTIYKRIGDGWTFEKAITTYGRPNDYYITYKGVTKTLAEWAKETGIKKSTLHARLKYRQWSVEKALTTPINHNM